MQIDKNLITEYKLKHIFQLFEDTKTKYPHKTAIVFKDQQLTFTEVYEKALAVAAKITANVSCTKSQPIGLYVDRGVELVLATLGIFAAGHTYVPLDPKYPKDRIQHIIKDSQIRTIVTQDEYFAELTQLVGHNINLVNLNEISKSHDFKPVLLNLDNPAYVIYTSGSTGIPKGVETNHFALSHYMKAAYQSLKLSTDDIYLYTASIAFSSSTRHLLVPLINGITVVIADDEERLGAEKYFTLLKQQNITVIDLVPSFFISLIDYFENIDQKLQNTLLENKLRLVVIGSEPLTAKTVQRWRNLFGSKLAIVNVYGGTELTGVVMHYLIPDHLSEECSTIPIGFPMDNTKAFILDENKNLIKDTHVVGELYIAGPAIANYYINSPVQTEAKFIENLEIDGKSYRAYRTGDLARVLSDDSIEHMGRIDRQIKLRGMRVELGEIEYHLNQFNNITRGIVILQEVNNNDCLVAYYTAKESININVLRKKLLNELPEYMLPSFFIQIEKFPLTPNGKVNIFELPIPVIAINNDRNNSENVSLITLWEKVLGVRPQSITDNFFHIGGNSLLVVKMLTLVHKQFGKKVNIQSFFREPTLEHLQLLLEDKDDSSLFLKQVEIDVNNVVNNVLPKTKKNVLLTGATGFLGVHLLYQITKYFSGDIYCLINADTIEAGTNKLHTSLYKYQLDLADSFYRIKVVLGDLAKPNLGIKTTTWEMLAKKVDYIFHNGAYVNHMYDYTMLKPTNVDSTITIIRLANMGKKKHIHFISTKKAENNFMLQKAGKNVPITLPSATDGYTLSKVVSEKILSEAWLNGTSVTVYRPGNITGSLSSGMSNFEHNHALLLLKACIEMGVSPKWEKTIEMFPVDIMSEAIVKLSIFHGSNGQNYNLSNPKTLPWDEYIKLINQNGYKVEQITVDEWIDDYILKLDESSSFYALKALYMNPPKFKEENIEYGVTQRVLDKVGITLPNDYQAMVSFYVNTLAAKGFLPATNLHNERVH